MCSAHLGSLEFRLLVPWLAVLSSFLLFHSEFFQDRGSCFLHFLLYLSALLSSQNAFPRCQSVHSSPPPMLLSSSHTFLLSSRIPEALALTILLFRPCIQLSVSRIPFLASQLLGSVFPSGVPISPAPPAAGLRVAPCVCQAIVALRALGSSAAFGVCVLRLPAPPCASSSLVPFLGHIPMHDLQWGGAGLLPTRALVPPEPAVTSLASGKCCSQATLLIPSLN